MYKLTGKKIISQECRAAKVRSTFPNEYNIKNPINFINYINLSDFICQLIQDLFYLTVFD